MSDMTITAVRTTILRVPWPQTPWLKGHAFGDARNFLVVDVETKGGITGMGYLFLFRPGIKSIIACLNEVIIPNVIGKDASAVEAIWQNLWNTTITFGRGGIATMAQSALDIALWDIVGKAAKLPLHRHVAADAATGRLLGWVAVSPVSARRVYAGVVEHSVYVDPARHRGGIGAALLAALIGSTEAAGIWTIQSSLFPENTASVRLHQQAGFRILGTRERIARHHGRWRDTVIMERRSSVAGTG